MLSGGGGGGGGSYTPGTGPNGEAGYYEAPDAKAVREADQKVADADWKVQQAELRLKELDADAKESQRRAAHAPDATVQSLMSRPYGGLSPIALALAHADWALHWMASPGRQAVLAQRAVELGSQAWQNVVADAMGASEETPDKDGRFADPSWRSWPYSAIKEGYKALSGGTYSWRSRCCGSRYTLHLGKAPPPRVQRLNESL